MPAGTLVSSGSSGNMPTGSGSERLCRASINTLNATNQILLSGTAGHIYTIISIIFANQQNATGTINIQLNDGSNNIKIVHTQSVGAYETFVWNDRFVLEEDDDLDVQNSCNEGDWWVSYIDQNWT